MLQAIEAVIETNGIVRLKEFVYPVRPVRAVKNAQAGNPVSMEAVIQANRTAWGD